MDLIIGCTAKPCDGLLYYSYEYASHLNAKLVIITHPNFEIEDYVNSIKKKYIHFKNVIFNEYFHEEKDVCLVMGRSMLTLPYLDMKRYTHEQIFSMKELFGNKLIAVYSNNHPEKYHEARKYWNPKEIINLYDNEVYPDVWNPAQYGYVFEKRINFSIYREPKQDIQFEHLLLGTNKEYYQTAELYCPSLKSYSIITYNEPFVNPLLQNIFAPIDNLLGLFQTYVYTKPSFDPAPRLVQECKYFGKDMVYQRPFDLQDGGKVYWSRPVIDIDVKPILKAIEDLS